MYPNFLIKAIGYINNYYYLYKKKNMSKGRKAAIAGEN